MPKMEDTGMTTTEIQAEIIAKQDELIREWSNPHSEDFTTQSRKILKAQSELADLKQRLAESEIAEIKATPMPSAWICPRCQKIHSWLSMTCDCEPKTITSTTY